MPLRVMKPEEENAVKIFIGMETSGEIRRRVADNGHDVISCDILPSEDGADCDISSVLNGSSPRNCHIIGDVFETLIELRSRGWWPDRAMFHPSCTYLTCSAEWAYKDPDFNRYPGIGYHQKLKPGTLFGSDRRQAREDAVADVTRIISQPIHEILIENPRGHLSARIGKPAQTLQPYQHGDDASKATCIWRIVDGQRCTKPFIPVYPEMRVTGRMVYDGNLMRKVERWSNQTDTGQSRNTPGQDRWKDRSRTLPGVAGALAKHLSR
jgi:hypothetical protein